MRAVLAFLFVLVCVQTGHSQCCAQGTPMGGAGNLGTLPARSFQLVSFYKFSESIPQKEDNPYFITGADFNFVGINLAYGVTPKLTAELDLGYFINKTQYYTVGINNYDVRGFGLSNGTFSLKYGIYKSRNAKWEIVGGMGLKFPFTTEYQIVDNVQVPVDNQPSTCGFGVAPKVLIFRKFNPQDMNIFFIHRTDYNFTNSQNYTYGHGFSNSIFVTKKLNFISCNMLGVVQFRHETRTMDIKPDGEPVTTTGSNTVFAAPQLGYTFFKKLFVSATYELPLYQIYNTEKLQYKQAFTFSLVLNLAPEQKELPKNIEVSGNSANTRTATLLVYGNCEMCKEKIESTLLGTKGVTSADWNIETKTLTVSYDEEVITLDDISEKVASVGYDTEKHRAPDKAYKKLHSCCQYERP